MGTPAVEDPKPQEESTNWKMIGLIVLIVVLLIACGLLTKFVLYPLAEPLFIQKATETPTLSDSDIEVITPEPTMVPEPTEKASACRQKGTMSFLVSGVDAPYTDEPKGADAIRLVKLDFSTSEVTIVALPRDLWVSTPALGYLDIAADRLGLTYYYGKENPPAGSDEVVYGTNILAQTIYDNFGFVPAHYLTVHIDNFDDIIDAIRGVTVTIPEEYQSVNYLFSPGVQQLDGDQALEYASNLLRQDTEWDRFDRQDLVMRAIYTKVTSPQILMSVPDLIKEFSQTITTDLSPLEITDLSCLLNDVTMEEINYVEIDQTMVTKKADSAILQPNYAKISALLAEIFE
jgi:LCP family protein required for cell wall assembly